MIISDLLQTELERILKREALVPREKLADLIDALKIRHILAITGVRRCGKSTLMKELIQHILEKKITTKNNVLYVNLENPYFNPYKDDVLYLTKIYDEFKKNIDPKRKIFVFFDEVQFFKDWQVFVKNLYENNEAKIIITGSNSKLLSPELATLLSGRTISYHLFPYSFFEFTLATKGTLLRYLKEGGFPEVAKLTDETQIRLLVENFYKNILYQDVIPRFEIKNSLEMENLSYYLLSNIAKELSYHTLQNISKLQDKTIKQYMSYLEDANLLYVINNYDHSLKKQIGNKKKVYSVDASFVNYLGFNTSPNFGRLLENAVYLELKDKYDGVFFFNRSEECDFVIKKGHKIIECIQVCRFFEDDKTRGREIQGLIAALDYFELDKGTIITQKGEEEIRVEGKHIRVVPFEKWILELRR